MSLKKGNDLGKKGHSWRFSKKKSKTGPEVEVLPYDLKELLEKKGLNLKPRVNSSKISKLSPSLLDILKKSVALGYFLEYLGELHKKCLLDFWLEAETLRMVSETAYSRPHPNRRLTRTKSLSSTPPKARRESCLDVCTKEENRNEITIPQIVSDQGTQVDNYDSCKINAIAFQRTHIDIHTKQSASADDFEASISFTGCNATTGSRNSFDPPTKRRSSTLRSYEEFKTRAKSRSEIVDAVEIYTKYISLDADYSINLPSGERQNIEATICKDENLLDPLCFVKAQSFAFQQLESMYDDFLSTTNMISYQLHVLEEKQLRLQDVLYDEPLLFYFLEFLDVHHAKDVYEFFVTAENFEEDIERRLHEDDYDLDECVNDAMYIYERYFSMKCERQLIADDKLRIVLENNICREDGPQANCFCIPMAYAWTALSEVYLPKFVRSTIYASYQTHLQKTLQRTEDMKSTSSRSSLSIDEHISLVGRSSPVGTSNLTSRSESKLNLFEETNLEDFWFKPQSQTNLNSGRLTLGHVNEFGMFCSGMEDHPLDERQKDSSVKKLGKKMKDLLRGETEEETEQLAWERARKIIDDIQKQTQPS